MAITRVTNKAAGPRGFNVATSAGGMRQVMLQPGETGEFDLDGAAHPALAGHLASGDLVFGEPQDDKARADSDAMLAEVEAKKQIDVAEKAAAEQKAREELAAKMNEDAKTLQEERDAELQAQQANEPGRGRRKAVLVEKPEA